ncbi:aspartate/glutamate racemase family protein [Roseobacter sp.]|uniref:aspartate/glutamate racemase family protein n=1 Tax=Roseobacter sp. TaxID=1907202 RepID=UPI00385B1972
MTRLLAINPNTSPEVTATFVSEARRIVPTSVTVDGVTGTFGARIVTSEAENIIAAHAALQLAAEHAGGVDGVILAISFDTGLRALSELLPVPVVGVTEAALLHAGDAPLGAICFGATSQPLYSRLLYGYGRTPVAWEVVEFASRADYLDAKARDTSVLDAIARLAEAGAERALLLGTAVVGMAGRLFPQAAIPVSDGAAAVRLCLERIETFDEPPPRKKPVAETVGLPPSLAALIAGKSQ